MSQELKGVIFSDLFITNKQIFIDFFEQYYLSNQQQIDAVSLKLNQVLTTYKTKQVTEKMASDFKQSWNDFQRYVLLNSQDLQLIVAYRGYQGKDAHFSQIVKQSEVEETVSGRYGINAGNDLIKDSMASLRAQKVEHFLQSHLNGFLNQLESPIGKQNEKLLQRYHSQLLHSDFKGGKAYRGLADLKWREPFYGAGRGAADAYFSGRGLGQAYDAFMNHLANYNRQVYDYLIRGGKIQTTSLDTRQRDPGHSVFNEEGGAGSSGNFPRLLNESKNSIGWYTGGDIVIVNPDTMSIVYNIQLKTTTVNKPSVFGEKVEAIRKFINIFIKTTKPKEKAEKLFDFLVTSVSNKNEFNNLPQSTIDDLIMTGLSKKLDISLKL